MIKLNTGKREKQEKVEFSKRLVMDIRTLLWIITISTIFLSWYSIHHGYTGSLPWLTAMVGLPWTAHGAVCTFYFRMATSDHREGGITYEIAKAANFYANPTVTVDTSHDIDYATSTDSPMI